MSKVAIVCIDDEPIILFSLKRQLVRNLGHDYDIELASSGQEALELCTELREEEIEIALIISDQRMPLMSGDELLVKLHATCPKALKILLTGHAEVSSVGKVVNSGALYRYIPKPWDETDFMLTVREALKCYGQESKLEQQNLLLHQSNQKLQKSLNLLLATLEAADDGLLVLDNQGHIVVCNQQFYSLWKISSQGLDFDRDDILDAIALQLSHPIACSFAPEEKNQTRQKYNLLKLSNGKVYESYLRYQQLETEEVGLVWGFRDVTAREKEKAIVQQKALRDTVTQLPKRKVITHRLSEAIIKAKKDSLLAVMIIDLDGFRRINKTFSHQIGDLILQQAVIRIKNSIREEDVVARWGNDEFILLLPCISRKEDIDTVAKRIISSFQPPFEINDTSLHISVSIGISIYPEHGRNARTLLQNVDSALAYVQQQDGQSYYYYDPLTNSSQQKLLTVENLLYSALDREEFILHYQPIIDERTGKITKMEALLRWQNPQLGLVSPHAFIPIAEENGLIIPIGEWVIKTVCAQNKAWQDMGLEPIKVSANLSVRQFQKPDLVDDIANILQTTKLAPQYLELEITESLTMKNTHSAKEHLEKLNALGIDLAMDDFGTGYSSLGYLKQFPFQTLKIDRSLVKDLGQDLNPQDIAIVEAIITLARGLNLEIVAEGVETRQQRDLLKQLGCHSIQGYFYSKPVPTDQATQLLQEGLPQKNYSYSQ